MCTERNCTSIYSFTRACVTTSTSKLSYIYTLTLLSIICPHHLENYLALQVVGGMLEGFHKLDESKSTGQTE